jgi:hypothetical protein
VAVPSFCDDSMMMKALRAGQRFGTRGYKTSLHWVQAGSPATERVPSAAPQIAASPSPAAGVEAAAEAVMTRVITPFVDSPLPTVLFGLATAQVCFQLMYFHK